MSEELIANGEAALRQALTEQQLEHEIDVSVRAYRRAMDGAVRHLEPGLLSPIDRTAFVTHVDAVQRAQLVEEAQARRQQAVFQASRMRLDWKRLRTQRRSVPLVPRQARQPDE